MLKIKGFWQPYDGLGWVASTVFLVVVCVAIPSLFYIAVVTSAQPPFFQLTTGLLCLMEIVLLREVA